MMVVPQTDVAAIIVVTSSTQPRRYDKALTSPNNLLRNFDIERAEVLRLLLVGRRNRQSYLSRVAERQTTILWDSHHNRKGITALGLATEGRKGHVHLARGQRADGIRKVPTCSFLAGSILSKCEKGRNNTTQERRGAFEINGATGTSR